MLVRNNLMVKYKEFTYRRVDTCLENYWFLGSYVKCGKASTRWRSSTVSCTFLKQKRGNRPRKYKVPSWNCMKLDEKLNSTTSSNDMFNCSWTLKNIVRATKLAIIMACDVHLSSQSRNRDKRDESRGYISPSQKCTYSLKPPPYLPYG